MDPSRPPFLRHGLQGSLESGTQRHLNTVGDIEAGLPGLGDTILQQNDGINGQSTFTNPPSVRNAGAPTEYDQHFTGLGTSRSSSLDQHAWLAHTSHVSGNIIIADWSSVGEAYQSPEFDPTSAAALTIDGPARARNSTLREFYDYPTSTACRDHQHQLNILPGNQELGQPTASEMGMIDAGQNVEAEGSVLRDRRFSCNEHSCKGVTLKRCAELWRHYDSLHDPHGERFWCHVTNCKRNKVNGGKPFNRI